MTWLRKIFTQSADSPSIDAFSRQRVSNPTAIFDAQLTYDLQPTVFEQLTNGSGAAIAHDATNRCADLTFSATPTGGQAIMQTFEHFRYQPLKSQLIAVTFNMKEGVANCLKFAGYSDGDNGIEFQMNGTTPRVGIYSTSGNGDNFVDQSNWNLDHMDGAGDDDNPSGITLDITKTQIFIIDFQALYVGRVRVGFDIDGLIYYVHEFKHANIIANPYIATANLPIRCGMTCTATVSTTMDYICSAVASEGGQEDTASYDFSETVAVTAVNGARTHALSLRPRTTFNSIANRCKIGFLEVEVTVTGNSPVDWELCFGQGLTTPSYANYNTTYSAVEIDTAGTINGSPSIKAVSGSVGATNRAKGSISQTVRSRYPISLDAAGNQRALGTATVVLTGVGGNSTTRVSLRWKEIR